MATTTPNVNLDPNFTKGSSAGYRDIVQDAFAGRLAEGGSLAASYNHGTWGGQNQTHHLIAQNMVNGDVRLESFFESGMEQGRNLNATNGEHPWRIAA